MARLSLLEYIPELSLIVAGSQGEFMNRNLTGAGCASVLLVRIVQNAVTGKYELLPETSLPKTPLPFPIVGNCCHYYLSK